MKTINYFEAEMKANTLAEARMNEREMFVRELNRLDNTADNPAACDEKMLDMEKQAEERTIDRMIAELKAVKANLKARW